MTDHNRRSTVGTALLILVWIIALFGIIALADYATRWM